MAKRRMKYNPAFLTDEELIGSFVVRHADLELILQVLRESDADSNQHLLVVGPRGSGKTMLALRVAAEARRDEALRSRWYPLVFAEESYSVTTPGEFWLEALFHLARQTGDDRRRRTHEELTAEPDETRLRERALAQLMDFADAEGKRILLIVENLNMLLGEQLSDDDAWVLRHTLQNEPRLMLLATATAHFEQIDNAGKAMFELFKPHRLTPLDTRQCAALWKDITGQEPTHNRIRPVEILTGGSPRLVAIISSFGSHLSLEQLMDDLVRLVDDHTDYFKSHLDALPAVERKAYLALAEIWDPATARDVARQARLNVSKTSALLSRLASRGAVFAEAAGPRKKLYRVAERMYNVYHLMRRPGAKSGRIRALVRFMTSIYAQAELTGLVRAIAQEACGLDPDSRADHRLAYEAMMEGTADRMLRRRLVRATPPEFLQASDVLPSVERWIKDAAEAEEELVRSLEEARDMIQRGERLKDVERICRVAMENAPDKVDVWVTLGLLHERSERHAEAAEAYRKAVDLAPQSPMAWVRLAFSLQMSSEGCDEAEEAYRKAIELDSGCVWAWEGLGRLLHIRSDRYEESRQAYMRAIEIDPARGYAWTWLIPLLLWELGRPAEAITTCKEAVEHCADDTDILDLAACVLFAFGGAEGMPRAEELARRSVARSPLDANYLRTLACILTLRGEPHEALEQVRLYLHRIKSTEDEITHVTALFAELAAKGLAREALEALTQSPSAEALEPLAVGLRLDLGEDVQVATEILEVGKDVAERIRRRREEIRAERAAEGEAER